VYARATYTLLIALLLLTLTTPILIEEMSQTTEGSDSLEGTQRRLMEFLQTNPNVLKVMTNLVAGNHPPPNQQDSSEDRGDTLGKDPAVIRVDSQHVSEIQLYGASKSTVSKSKKIRKTVNVCDLSDNEPHYEDFKSDFKSRHLESERRRISDLKEVHKKIKPTIKAIELCMQQALTQNEMFTIVATSLQDLLRFLGVEARTSALCAEYSLDPKKHAAQVRRILDLETTRTDQADRVSKINDQLQRERHNTILEASIKRQGPQGARTEKENYKPFRRDGNNNNNNNNNNNFKNKNKEKATAQGEAVARDV